MAFSQLQLNRAPSPFTSAASCQRRSCHPLPSRRSTLLTVAGVVQPGDLVTVVGAAGGVGQILTAKLLERGYRVRAVVRNAERAAQVFGTSGTDALEVRTADLRDPANLVGLMEGSDAVCCATGTTAFPSKRWDDNNGPEQTDLVSNRNLFAATPKSIQRFVFATSTGVTRHNKFPFFILNLFGVLKFKRQAEEILEASGLPYTIIRPARLTDGPYTSYDLNTLLKATSGTRQDVQLSLEDDQSGEASRIAVAEAMLQALSLAGTEGQRIALESKEGAGPGTDAVAWKKLFEDAR